jgi:hypothetical protein
MSGGSDFVLETRPADRPVVAAATGPVAAPPAPADSATVTRAASLPLIAPRDADPAPPPAGITPARFLTPPDDGAPADDGAVQWASAADAVAQAIATETALRTGQAQPAAAGTEGAARTAPAGIVSVNGSLVNVRMGPGTDYSVLASLPRGTEVDLVDIRNGWAMIRLSSGEEGWMAEYLLDGL